MEPRRLERFVQRVFFLPFLRFANYLSLAKIELLPLFSPQQRRMEGFLMRYGSKNRAQDGRQCILLKNEKKKIRVFVQIDPFRSAGQICRV